MNSSNAVTHLLLAVNVRDLYEQKESESTGIRWWSVWNWIGSPPQTPKYQTTDKISLFISLWASLVEALAEHRYKGQLLETRGNVVVLVSHMDMLPLDQREGAIRSIRSAFTKKVSRFNNQRRRPLTANNGGMTLGAHNSLSQGNFSRSRSSYRLSNNLSTHPSLGNCLSQRLWRCTAKMFRSARSRPPFSSSPYPSAQCPSERSGVNGSGTLLSSRQARGSLKQKGRILNGGRDSARRRRHKRRYRIAPQSVDGERGGVEVAIKWNASQR